MARAEAQRLGLRDATPLERELSGEGAAGLRHPSRSPSSLATIVAGR
jgi:hypothetical protein